MPELNKETAPRYWDTFKEKRPWRDLLDERELKEVKLSTLYKEEFAHGTTGHNQLLLIAHLASLLDFIDQNFRLVEKDE